MRWDEWRFSAKLAWQDRFVRWTTLGTALFHIGITAFVLWRIMPGMLRTGIVTYHYNIYLGVDDVRTWQWIIAPLATMFAVIVVNAFVGFGVYRQDRLAAKALLGLSIALSLLWATAFFFLVTINV